MPNPYFQFKQFTVYHDRCALKVTTDACLFGAWCAEEIESAEVKIQKALDIGMGTGLLSLMVAQKNPALQIDAIEIDADTWVQGCENISRSPWQTQIHPIQADVKEYPFKELYDCIISNPPFYQNELQTGNTKRNIALHSAALELEELFRIIKSHLLPAGVFFLLLPYKREKEVEVCLQRNQLFTHKKLFIRQSALHGYFRILIKGGLSQLKPVQIEELDIWNSQQKYTAAFTHLLKDYYLYL